jgi:hypothetical protein
MADPIVERTNELLSKAAGELLQELGPMSDDPNRRAAQQIEFDQRYAAAKRAARQQAVQEVAREEMQRRIDRRGQEWVELTGSTLGLEEQRLRWKQQYLDERDYERELLRQQAIDAHYDW